MTASAKRLTALIILVAIGALATVVYSKGVRFPPPQFEPRAVATTAVHPSLDYRITAKGAYSQHIEDHGMRFRAFAPQPEITVVAEQSTEFSLRLENVHPQALLTAGGAAVTEHTTGLVRQVRGRTAPGASLQLKWRFPKPDTYRFTAIGDTGGDAELRWVLQRSAQLGADFVLHLGDINYSPEDFSQAVDTLNTSPLPVYVAIGNHDFHDAGRSIHGFFTRHIGPRNSTFTLGGVGFVNLDTAAFAFPWSTGARGRLVRDLPPLTDTSSGIREYVVFTHKPLNDPRATETDSYSHSLGWLEARWLRREFLRRGVRWLLAGHIHIATEFEHQGLKTYISGQGLAHADLIVDRPVARILVGEVAPGQAVKFRWDALDMPFAAHCSPRGWEVLEALGKLDVLATLSDRCGEQSVGVR
jgi:predicted phosphodiesterase